MSTICLGLTLVPVAPSSAAGPTITSFSPTAGGDWTRVWIAGTGFGRVRAVEFNGAAATFTVLSSTRIRTKVPPSATTGPITVRSRGGSDTSTESFVVHPRIVIDPAEVLGPVHRAVFGVNHRYAYDGFGMWDPALRQPEPAFLDAFRTAGLSSMRFPGGSIANTYRWERAIGPPAERGLNIHGRTGEPLTNEFGPDEFGRLAEDEGLEGTIVVNFATADAEEAADWVEYMNAPAGTNPGGGVAWAEVRAANGHPLPYDIRYWEVGNELYDAQRPYWLGTGTLEKRTRKYVFGGSTAFVDQLVGKEDDHRASAAKSDGSSGQTFQVLYPPVKVNNDLAIEVNGTEWTRVSDLGTAGPTDQVYRLDPATGDITFGDGVRGAIPPSGATVRATYTSGPHDGFVDYYRAMKAIDGDIEVGSCMPNRHFLSFMGSTHPYDVLAAHSYSPGIPPGYADAGDVHDAAMRQAFQLSEVIAGLKEDVRTYAGQRADDVDITITEYALTLGKGVPSPTEHYAASMDQALYVALILRHWIRLGVPLASKHSLIDLAEPVPGSKALSDPDQAVIGPSPDFIPSATARMYELVTGMSGTERLGTTLRDNPRRTTYTGDELNMLHVMATADAAGDTYLLVVNVDRERDVTASIALRGGAIAGGTVSTLTAPSFLSYNSESDPDAASIQTTPVENDQPELIHTFPAHSVTAIRVPAA